MNCTEVNAAKANKAGEELKPWLGHPTEHHTDFQHHSPTAWPVQHCGSAELPLWCSPLTETIPTPTQGTEFLMSSPGRHCTCPYNWILETFQQVLWDAVRSKLGNLHLAIPELTLGAFPLCWSCFPFFLVVLALSMTTRQALHVFTVKLQTLKRRAVFLQTQKLGFSGRGAKKSQKNFQEW